MVGNAEPVKEYNYRPLSKLCECQLDVNDQVSTKGWREGGQAEMEGKKRKRGRDRKRGFNFFSSLSPSDVPAPSWAHPIGPNLFEPTRCPKSPTAATAIALGWELLALQGLWHK